MSTPKSNVLWEFFKKSTNKTALCLACHNKFSYKTTVTNLKMHLFYKHKHLFEQLNRGQNVSRQSVSYKCRKIKSLVQSPQVDDEDKNSFSSNCLWKYFDKFPDGSKTALCLTCFNTFSYKTSVTNLKSHLSLKHKSLYKLLYANIDCSAKSNECDDVEDHEDIVEDLEYIVEDHEAIVEDHEDIVEDHEDIVEDHEAIVEDHEDIVEDHEDIVEDHEDIVENHKDIVEDHEDILDNEVVDDSTLISTRESIFASLIGNNKKKSACDISTTSHSNYLQMADKTASSRKIKTGPKPHSAEMRLLQDENILYAQEKGLSLDEKNKLDLQLLKLCTNSCQPFTIVQDQGFREFVGALNSDYDLPDVETLSTTLLAKTYQEFLETKKLMVSKAKSVCLTLENWSSVYRDSYISITAHFFNEHLEICSVFLQCIKQDNYNSQHTAEILKALAYEWEIYSSVNFLVTDSTPFMISVANKLNTWTHFGCFARNINLIVENILQDAKKLINKLQKVVTIIKMSSEMEKNLLEYQKKNTNSKQPLSLIKSKGTNLISVYTMLERFSNLKEAIQATTLSMDLPMVSHEEWLCIEQLCVVLKPFYIAIQEILTEYYLTASKALTLTSSLIVTCEKIMSETNESELQHKWAKDLLSGLYIRVSDMEKNIHIAICALLDPRFKTYVFQDKKSVEYCKNFILNKMATILEDQNDYIEINRTGRTKANEELSMYLAEKVIECTKCPLNWWRSNKSYYPTLYSLFSKYCNIFVTSVPCKRIKSEGNKFSQHADLPISKLNQVMFLNLNKFK